MSRVCTEHLEPGMVLLKDVRGADGSVILASGLALEPDHIEALAELGVSHVFIRTGAGEPDREALLRRASKYVRGFFMYVDQDVPLFGELFRLCVAQTAKAMAKGWQLPCSDELTAKRVEHLSDLFLRDKGTAADVVAHETEMASFPDIYIKVKNVIDSPTSTADDIATVVNTDLGLAAKLLRLVNSPLFGFTAPVESVARAVSLIGVKELSTLALGITTVDFFKDIPPELMDMKVFWRHSLRCGILAKLLASRVEGAKPERFFTAGLLHDVGRLIVFKNMPYASVEAMIFARSNFLPLVEAERLTLGYDHTDVGRLLLSAWRFPTAITDLIAGHHAPGDTAEPTQSALLQLADNLANAAEISSGWMYVLPGMQQQDLDQVGLNPKDLAGLMATHDRDLQEIITLIS